MPASPHYAWETFYFAIRNLAAGSGDLRTRLESAYTPHLQSLRVRQIPWPAAQDKLSDLLELLVAAISRDAASADLMTEGDRQTIAGNLFDLFNRVHEEYVLHQHGLQ